MKRAKPNVLIGLAAGDMLGAPMEFMTAAQVRAVYGNVQGPVAQSRGAFEAGEFTDDTQMALCILAAYPARVGEDASGAGGLVARAAAGFREWAAIPPRDIGNLTRAALATDGVEAWRASGRTSCGNGALMRAAASVAAGSTGAALLNEAAQLGAITHADPRSVACCVAYCAALDSLAGGDGVANVTYADAWTGALALAAGFDAAAALRRFGDDYAVEVGRDWSDAVAVVAAAVKAALSGRGAGNGGFAVSTLQTSVVHGAADTFAEGVLPVVREGDDSDTVAAITGAILGARGLLPPDAWLAALRCGERWSAWPDAAQGPAAVRRLEDACRRAVL